MDFNDSLSIASRISILLLYRQLVDIQAKALLS